MTNRFDDLLSCINCRSTSLARSVEAISCQSCGTRFAIEAGIPVFLRSDNVYATEPSRALFWDAGWRKRFEAVLTQNDQAIRDFREDFLVMLQRQKYPAVTEIGPSAAGRLLLNVGCGGGQEGLLFAGFGARYIGVDFSHNAARFTQIMIERLGYDGVCYQCEGERLPLRDSSVDLIYSNGVLHHTPNTQDGLNEICRVLAPGGKAVIGLYATYSLTFFWYRFRAVVAGNFTPRAIERWVDANTEGEWQTGDRQNRYTRTYDRKTYREMLAAAGFRDIRIVQSQLQIKDLPVIGRLTQIFPQSFRDFRIGRFGMMLIAICTK